jgi:hypothetical protein
VRCRSVAVATSSLVIPSQAFAQLPIQLRADLLESFARTVGNYAEGRWEPSELNGGKLCEAAYSICEGIASGSFPPQAQKPKDMVGACKTLEKHTSALRSVRIQIPRMVVALYEIRNSRNVGHLGGEVDPNHMDSLCVLQMSKWIVAELVRILHRLPVDEAVVLVETLVEREVPLVWKVAGKRRVLDPSMGIKDKTLLLLHGSTGAVAETDLAEWAEHGGVLAHFRRDVLKRQHRAKLLEFDPRARTATISPLGVAYVEDEIIRPRVGALN